MAYISLCLLSTLWKMSIFSDEWSFTGVHMQSPYNVVHTEIASGGIKHKIVSSKAYQKS